MEERFLVTGALGCIGAWVVRQLLVEGVPTVALDAGTNTARLSNLVDHEGTDLLELVNGDITDESLLLDLLDSRGVTNVIHLAALQVPFCRQDPVLGARVNVVGTVNVFESVRQSGSVRAPIVFASSVATYDDADGDAFAPSHPMGRPATHYGVYKRANEGTAFVYANDHGVSSIGLRPYVVYGVGRDQGMTSTPTQAMLAAVQGQPYRITYGGRSQMQYAEDVAADFVRASRSGFAGSDVFNLPGAPVDMAEIVAAIEKAVPESVGLIGYDDIPMPFPDEVDSGPLVEVVGVRDVTTIEDGVARTTQMFRDLIAAGRF